MGADRFHWEVVSNDDDDTRAQLAAARARVVDLTMENEQLVEKLRRVSNDSARSLAMMAWFASRGASNAGQWPGDPDDFAKQTKAREEFDAWWSAA